MLTYSEDFSNAAWPTTNVTVTPNATVAPDGASTADKIEVTTTAATIIARTTSSAGSASGNTYSIYVKKGSGATDANIFLLRNNTTATNLALVTINYDTGVVSQGTGTGAFSVNVGNGWWRLVLPATTGISAGDALVVYVCFTGGTETAGEFAYVWGAQLEAGSFATSYIPTQASQVTRAADNASMLGDNFATWYQQAQGSWAASWIPSVVNGSVIAQISASTNADRFQLLNDSTGQVAVTTASVGQGSIDAGTVNAGAINKLAYAYQTNNTAASLNAGAAATDNTVTLPTVDRLCIGATVLQQGHLNGAIRSISYYPTRLADATLQSITS